MYAYARKLMENRTYLFWLNQINAQSTCSSQYSKDGDRKPRGFGFVTYATSACVDKVIDAKKDSAHVLDGREIDVKRALPKEVRYVMMTCIMKIKFHS